MYRKTIVENHVAEVVLDHPPVNALPSEGWAHLAGLGVFLGGLALVATVLLPRLGYAATVLPWMCE